MFIINLFLLLLISESLSHTCTYVRVESHGYCNGNKAIFQINDSNYAYLGAINNNENRGFVILSLNSLNLS